MKIAIAATIPAPRDRVFAALIGPAVLQRCIPGCEALTVSGPDTFAATLEIGVAGLKGTYGGNAAIRDNSRPTRSRSASTAKVDPGSCGEPPRSP
jgi:carbon monoxide dehydrogenase subunit G